MSQQQKMNLEVFWPKITTIEKARSVAMQGYGATMISAAFTALVFLLSIYDFIKVEGVDGFAIIDVALQLFLAWGIWKMSRIAATIAFIYFIISKILLIAENGVGSPVFVIFLAFLYINGIRGTFAFQKLKR